MNVQMSLWICSFFKQITKSYLSIEFSQYIRVICSRGSDNLGRGLALISGDSRPRMIGKSSIFRHDGPAEQQVGINSTKAHICWIAWTGLGSLQSVTGRHRDSDLESASEESSRSQLLEHEQSTRGLRSSSSSSRLPRSNFDSSQRYLNLVNFFRPQFTSRLSLVSLMPIFGTKHVLDCFLKRGDSYLVIMSAHLWEVVRCR